MWCSAVLIQYSPSKWASWTCFVPSSIARISLFQFGAEIVGQTLSYWELDTEGNNIRGAYLETKLQNVTLENVVFKEWVDNIGSALRSNIFKE